MKRATSLTVIAIGAIFAFAITVRPHFLNLQVVGWILMATGVAGLLLERRNRDWLRRTVIVRRSPDISRSRPSAEGPTQPIDKSVERDTIEEYIEP